MSHTCYISIGSNLTDRYINSKIAISKLESFIKILSISSFYETEPWGYQDENFYINCVLKGETSINPVDLLFHLKKIEKEMGRIPDLSNRYHSRIIDLDILFFDNIIINTDDLIIPHPKLYNRNYVLEPFFEINPDFKCPVRKKKISQILKESKDTSRMCLYTH